MTNKWYSFLVKSIAFIAIASTVSLLISAGTGGELEEIEPYIELINLLLITTVLLVGGTLLFKMGGVIKTAIISLNVVLVLFWIRELLAVLNAFDIVAIHGTYRDILELLMIITLLFAMDKLRQLL